MKPAYVVAATIAMALSGPAIAHADDPLPACQSGQVVVGVARTEAAVTHRAALLIFELASYAPPCAVTGYPGVDTKLGGPPQRAERTLRGYLGGLPTDVNAPPTIDLAKGVAAYAVIEGDAVDGDGAPCPTYTSLRVTPPDNTDTQNVFVTLQTCTLQVHPVASTL